MKLAILFGIFSFLWVASNADDINCFGPKDPSYVLLAEKNPFLQMMGFVPLPTMKPVYYCPPQSLWDRYLTNLRKAMKRRTANNRPLGSQADEPRPGCIITHYTKYSTPQQVTLVEFCLRIRFTNTTTSFLSDLFPCDRIYKANPEHDKILPEFIAMRKFYNWLLTEQEKNATTTTTSIETSTPLSVQEADTTRSQEEADREADLALAKSCFAALLEGEWDTEVSCPKLTPIITESSNERESFRRSVFFELLQAHCSGKEDKPDRIKNHCQNFNTMLENQCQNASVKGSLCDKLPAAASDSMDFSKGPSIKTI